MPGSIEHLDHFRRGGGIGGDIRRRQGLRQRAERRQQE
jgi:hypothetical protein